MLLVHIGLVPRAGDVRVRRRVVRDRMPRRCPGSGHLCEPAIRNGRAGTESDEEAASVRVVVTGATGNVGTAVVDALRADAAVTEIVAIARRAPDRMPPKTRFVRADVAAEDLTPH